MITIEEFIKHLESRGYKDIGDCGGKNNKDFYRGFRPIENPDSKIVYYSKDGRLSIENEMWEHLFNGFIESLEQFDLIDRLTN